jgi:hypothetical protein
MNWNWRYVVVGTLLAFGAVATAPRLAQGESSARRIAPRRAEKRSANRPLLRRPTQRINFGDDLVEGVIATGSGTLINGRPPAKQSHLLITRANFLPELLKSAEDL